MKNTFKMVSVVLVVFSLLLGLKALAASADLATVSAGTYKPVVKTAAVSSVSYPTAVSTINATPVYSVAPASCQPANNTILAENVKAGIFGAHVGNGDYTFPANLTVNGQMFLNNKVGIGLANPEAALHVYDSTGMTPLEISSIPNHADPMIKLKGYNSMDWMWIDSNSVDNTFIGVEAGVNTVGQPAAGRNDIFIGYKAGYTNMFSTDNTAIGNNALYSVGLNYGQNYNVALGNSAGYYNTGSGNIFLGYKSGYYETGSNKLYIDNDGNDALIYGDFAAGKVGINTITPDATLRVNGSIKANSYYSANGNIGITKTVKLRSTYNQPCTMSFENGLLTSTTCPTQ